MHCSLYAAIVGNGYGATGEAVSPSDGSVQLGLW
jgi:hypothetical protein